MKFNLTRPCDNCPFRSDRHEQRGWLGRERAAEITHAVLREDKTFTCHKTLERSKAEQSMCAGALTLLRGTSRDESPFGNAMVQVAERLGLYDPTTLRDDVPVFRTAQEMEDFHAY